MRVLLDTHIVLWDFADDIRLSQAARQIVSDPENEVYVSAASAWEAAIKKALGKLDMRQDFEKVAMDSGFVSLDITLKHAAAAGALPRHHDDPFDRMLIAQAMIEKLTLLTADRRLAAYGDFVKLVV